MCDQLEQIAKSYDDTIDLGKNGIDRYADLPEYITNDPDYAVYRNISESGTDGSQNKDIIDYLSPNDEQKLIDLGCCLNLMFKDYDKWPSQYFGVDISKKTIDLLNEYVAGKHLKIGDLFCGSIHDTHYENNMFDIGVCMGVLEYYEKEFVEKAIIEVHRIMKPEGKLVLDIPCLESPMSRISMMIEEYIGRPNRFNMAPTEFEKMIEPYFDIVKTDKTLHYYFLKCKK